MSSNKSLLLCEILQNFAWINLDFLNLDSWHSYTKRIHTKVRNHKSQKKMWNGMLSNQALLLLFGTIHRKLVPESVYLLCQIWWIIHDIHILKYKTCVMTCVQIKKETNYTSLSIHWHMYELSSWRTIKTYNLRCQILWMIHDIHILKPQKQQTKNGVLSS